MESRFLEPPKERNYTNYGYIACTQVAYTQAVGWSKKPEFVMRSPSWIRAARSGPGWGSTNPRWRPHYEFRFFRPSNRLRAGYVTIICVISLLWRFEKSGFHCILDDDLWTTRCFSLSSSRLPSPRSLSRPSTRPRPSRANPRWRHHYEFRFFSTIQPPACRLMVTRCYRPNRTPIGQDRKYKDPHSFTLTSTSFKDHLFYTKSR